MLSFKMDSPDEVVRRVSARAKRRRIDLGLTQEDLASRAGVSFGSLKLFEQKGKASFEALVKIAFALEAEDELENLFPAKPHKTIDDIIERPARQRVRKR